MKKILFVTYGGGHMKIIEPIAKELLKNKDIEFKILGLTSSYKYLLNSFDDFNVKSVSDYSFLFDDIINEILKYGLEFLDDNYTPNGLVTKEQTIFYIGLSFYDLVQREGKKRAYELYKTKKRQAFLPISIMKEILKYENVDIVVSTTSPRFEQASFMAANELGVQTLEILDLFAEIYPLPEAKNIVVMNESVKDGLIKQNLKHKSYYILGQPAIENTQNLIKTIDINFIKNKIEIDDKITIVFITQKMVQFNEDISIGHDIEYKYILDNLFSIIKSIKKSYAINILLRVHPSEDIKNYEQYLNENKYVKYINAELDLNETIAVSDMVVLHSSTVGVESIVSNKIVFTYKHGQDIRYPYEEMQKPPFIFSNGFQELKENLCKYLDNPMKQEQVENFMPNNSAKNIATLIKEL